jgi:hypothetical protein
MIERTSAPDKFVYHYTKVETARDYILKKRALQFGSFTTTNDPKETKSWDFDLITFEDRDLGKYSKSDMSERFSSDLKSAAKVACFCVDLGPLTGEPISDIYRRGYSKARMWAQYADRHTGVCLVFDKEKLLASVRQHLGKHRIAHGKVSYRDAPQLSRIEHQAFSIDIDLYESLGPFEYAREHLKRHGHSLFFEKLVDWRDEMEWRVVVFADTPGNVHLPIEDSLVAVVHGDRTDPDASEVLMSQAKEIQHLSISWKNGAPWYDYASFGWIRGKVTRPRRKFASRATWAMRLKSYIRNLM